MLVELFQFAVLIFIAILAVIFVANKVIAWWSANQAMFRAKIIALLSTGNITQQPNLLSEPHPDLVHVQAKFKELGVVPYRG